VAYTPPSYNAVSFTWLGDSAYTAPAYNSVDFGPVWAEGGSTATAAVTVTAVFTGFQAGAVSGVGSCAATSTAMGYAGSRASGAASSTATATAARVLPSSASATAAASSNVRIGSGLNAVFSTTASSTGSGTSSVSAASTAVSASAVVSGTGAWDGPSGGDAVTTATPTISVLGRGIAHSVFTESGSGAAAATAAPVFAVPGSISVTATGVAQSGLVIPSQAVSLNIGWNGGTTATAYAAYQAQGAGTATISAQALGVGALFGDAMFVAIASTNAVAVGQGDYTAAVVARAMANSRGRAYSADARQNKFAVTAASTATAVSDSVRYSSAAARASTRTIATAVGFWTQYIAGIGQSVAASHAYSFRGSEYDQGENVYTYTFNKPAEVSIFIGA
jgi:hypothetical protein